MHKKFCARSFRFTAVLKFFLNRSKAAGTPGVFLYQKYFLQVKSLILVGTLEKMCAWGPYST
ncbi:hypothetical protein LBK6_15165 [Leptospira borgpetersenii serovar Hardjo]|nr:hypothetical protein LBK6_15165 [Leptospira borgpetersenii serovar Hardjo]AWV71317.1 hypothetical protein B9T54_16240 [Leptospira borgpetersenii serovar Hardjo-bovis]AMX62838.1 hypothetical protein LBK9_15085 [Leptospira borgpetersenii serovar Hardjo]AMX66081.1 hypothetical protein LBK30_15090 [Leptospira borgpetersenii serovar Hardjo]AMX69313.1 hypothetical protein LBHA_15050 [Leptospira borgpetersenii serovar Hardjo]